MEQKLTFHSPHIHETRYFEIKKSYVRNSYEMLYENILDSGYIDPIIVSINLRNYKANIMNTCVCTHAMV